MDDYPKPLSDTARALYKLRDKVRYEEKMGFLSDGIRRKPRKANCSRHEQQRPEKLGRRRFSMLHQQRGTVCHRHFKNYLTLRHSNETLKHYSFSERFISH